MATANITHDTSTRHDIRVIMPDDVLGKVEADDEVYITLVGRGRDTQPIKLPRGAVYRLLDDGGSRF